MTIYCAYFRVSTARQGASGLGLEAQQAAVRRFLRDGDHLAQSFVEIESGKRNDRPQLQAALAACRRNGATLIIGKLDRLSRNLAFIANLMESDVRFVAVDLPDADRFRLHLEACIAEEERRRISERTKLALQAAKARGVVLGGYRGRVLTSEERKRGVEASAKQRTQRAAQGAALLAPLIAELRAQGITSLNALAKALTERDVPTPRGAAKWQPIQVRRLLASTA